MTMFPDLRTVALPCNAQIGPAGLMAVADVAQGLLRAPDAPYEAPTRLQALGPGPEGEDRGGDDAAVDAELADAASECPGCGSIGLGFCATCAMPRGDRP